MAVSLVSNLSDRARPETGDVASCDAEPIRIPSAVQPPGVLLVVRESDGVILQASKNAADILKAGPTLIGRQLSDVLPRGYAGGLEILIRSKGIEHTPVLVPADPATGRGGVDVMVHRWNSMLIVEIDPVIGPDDDMYRVVGEGFPALSAAVTLEDLSTAASVTVRKVTGYDRVMVYRFDAEANGQVTGESFAPGVEPWLGLRYPASDIPAQARAMYVVSRTRVVADVNYVPVPIEPATNPDTQSPVDLTHAVNRSVSPIHLQYLRNMGVGASMSFSIVWQGRLWGMILCHHPTPRPVSYRTRIACDVLAQNLALQLSVLEKTGDFATSLKLKSMQPRLLAAMSESTDLLDGLSKRIDELCNLGGGDGVAICTDRLLLHGQTPSSEQTIALIDWLAGHTGEDVFQTDSLTTVYKGAESYRHVASGLLAVSISRTRKWFILWFRPEVFRTRYWAGDPKKPLEITANGLVMRPRSDFARWKQTLEWHSVDWQQHHVDAVTDFRHAAVGIVLKQAEERARLSNELERSNKELEAFSYSVSHDLRAPFRHIVGFCELLSKRNKELDPTSQRYMATINTAAQFAGVLVDSLLTFSQMGRAAMRVSTVSLNDVIADVRAELAPEIGTRSIEWHVDPIPFVAADPMMVRMVILNLLSNAVKYTRGKPIAVISVRYVGEEPRDDLAPITTEQGMKVAAGGPLLAFEITDNGAGFDMKYVDKLFGVFQRLHRPEEFEGTGIGLANVRRIVERHGGRVSARGELDKGATIRVSFPAAILESGRSA